MLRRYYELRSFFFIWSLWLTEVSAKTLGVGTLYGIITQFWRIGSRFFLTPLVIAKIGIEGYGSWTLIFSLCSYISIMDIGFSLAYAKLTAEYDAKGEYVELSSIISSGIVFLGFFSSLAGLVVWLFRETLLLTFGITEHLIHHAAIALGIVLICVVLRLSFGGVFHVLSGIQRIDLRYKLGILASTIEFVVTIVLLWQDLGLLALAIGYLCGQVLSTAAAWYFVHRLCPQFCFSPLHITLKGFGKVLSLGGRFQFLSFLSQFIQEGTKLIISSFVGVSFLGIYEIANKLLSLASAVGSAITAPLMPAFANIEVSTRPERSERLYEQSSKLLSLICIPCFGFIAIFADPLVFLWTGNTYPLAGWTVRCMFAGLYIHQLTGPGTSRLRARGTIRLEIYYTLMIAVTLSVSIVPAYMYWGYKGIVVSSVISTITGSVWFLVSILRRGSVDISKYVKDTFVRPLIVLVPIIVLTRLLFSNLKLPVVLENPRLTTLLDIIICDIVYAVVIGVLGWFGIYSRTERASLVRQLRG